MFQKVEDNLSAGYKLFNLGSHWELHSSTGVYMGDLKKVCTFAVEDLGFLFKDLEIAVEEMEKNFHNAAEFGIYKHFIFTFEKELDNARPTLH